MEGIDAMLMGATVFIVVIMGATQLNLPGSIGNLLAVVAALGVVGYLVMG
jgi:hypothetical protein